MSFLDSLKLRILKAYLTRERVLGYAQHGMQWLAAWLVANHWLGEPASDFIGYGMAAAAILWSAFTGGKEHFWHVAAGVGRHILSMAAAVAIFKGWVDDATANHIIGAVLGLAGVSLSAVAPEKTRETARRQEFERIIGRRP